MLRRVAIVVEVLGLLAVAVFVAMLFTNQPSVTRPQPEATGGASTPATLSPAHAKELYSQACASCHGEEGEGIYGPAIAGESSTKRFASEQDEIAIVTAGLGQMKSFSAELTPDQIKAVVAYVRSLPTTGG
ncbi:MAG: cytochrome c [Actinobacteria bacterium]|nr:cytochrome c [Actinomycetota bacterium]